MFLNLVAILKKLSAIVHSSGLSIFKFKYSSISDGEGTIFKSESTFPEFKNYVSISYNIYSSLEIGILVFLKTISTFFDRSGFRIVL